MWTNGPANHNQTHEIMHRCLGRPHYPIKMHVTRWNSVNSTVPRLVSLASTNISRIRGAGTRSSDTCSLLRAILWGTLGVTRARQQVNQIYWVDFTTRCKRSNQHALFAQQVESQAASGCSAQPSGPIKCRLRDECLSCTSVQSLLCPQTITVPRGIGSRSQVHAALQLPTRCIRLPFGSRSAKSWAM